MNYEIICLKKKQRQKRREDHKILMKELVNSFARASLKVDRDISNKTITFKSKNSSWFSLDFDGLYEPTNDNLLYRLEIYCRADGSHMVKNFYIFDYLEILGLFFNWYNKDIHQLD